jgi:death-on-curing protein
VIEPIFLTIEQVEKLQARAITEHGGTFGIRDRHTLQSAVIHPQNIFIYGHGDLFDIAAGYCFHIAEAQAFLDGNKRAGASAALAFLKLNGISTKADPVRLQEAMIAIAEHRMGKIELAAVFRELASGD